MKVSLNWLSDFIDVAPLRGNLKDVMHKLTMRGLEVESVQDLSAGFQNVVTAQVLEKSPHPDATKLSLCQVSDGSQTYQIVCGAQNFKARDKVILSKEGAHLPNGMKIIASEIRGVKSFGMLCSEVELGLADESPGIVVLPADTALGVPAATYFGRDDLVFEINVTPNRGDVLSIVGVARELASILNQPWDESVANLVQTPLPAVQSQDPQKIKSITVQDENLCPQYHGILLEGVKVGPSPAWLVKRLEALGQRSINNVVDLTNYVMLEWGTPLHAFDAEKLNGFPAISIDVRSAKPAEVLLLLDQTQVNCQGGELLITDGTKPLALAGVMGGSESEVTDSTKYVFLEAAQFDAPITRQTARRFQKHTEASHRFERMIDPNAVMRGACRAVKLFEELASARVVQGPVSVVNPALLKSNHEPKKITLALKQLQALLGLQLSGAEAVSALESIGFKGIIQAGSDAKTELSVPSVSFRPDVQGPEDLCEEVLRVIGFDRVVATLPQKQTNASKQENASGPAKRALFINKVREYLSQCGFHECVNFSFSSSSLVKQWTVDAAEEKAMVSLKNPLSEEFETLRTSLLSGLFKNLVYSWRHQESEVRLFEIRPVFLRDEKCEQGVREEWRLAIMGTGRSFASHLKATDASFDFFSLKGIFEGLLDVFNVRGLRYQAAEDQRFHPFQSVKLILGRGPCGILGRLHPLREQNEKLRQPTYALEVSLDRIFEMLKSERKVQLVSKFPRVPRDFSLIVPKAVFADKVVACIQKHAKPLLETVQVVDVYEGEKIPPETRSLSVSLLFADASRTLEESEIEAMSAKILKGLEDELSVKLRMV